MDLESLIQTASGAVEGYGITVLDVVKHATKAIIASMGENDRLCLVSRRTARPSLPFNPSFFLYFILHFRSLQRRLFAQLQFFFVYF